jgi:hypothetical protein
VIWSEIPLQLNFRWGSLAENPAMLFSGEEVDEIPLSARGLNHEAKKGSGFEDLPGISKPSMEKGPCFFSALVDTTKALEWSWLAVPSPACRSR